MAMRPQPSLQGRNEGESAHEARLARFHDRSAGRIGSGLRTEQRFLRASWRRPSNRPSAGSPPGAAGRGSGSRSVAGECPACSPDALAVAASTLTGMPTSDALDGCRPRRLRHALLAERRIICCGGPKASNCPPSSRPARPTPRCRARSANPERRFSSEAKSTMRCAPGHASAAATGSRASRPSGWTVRSSFSPANPPASTMPREGCRSSLGRSTTSTPIRKMPPPWRSPAIRPAALSAPSRATCGERTRTYAACCSAALPTK